MTAKQEAVYKISQEVYRVMATTPQLIIDLVQDGAEELFSMKEAGELTRDSIGAVAYSCDLIAEVIDTNRFFWAYGFLKRLKIALDEWAAEVEATNKLLGLPPEA